MKCINWKTEDPESNDRKCPEFTRKKKIKETMAFANKSYFETSLLNLKMKIDPKPQFHVENFPALKNKEIEKNIISS